MQRQKMNSLVVFKKIIAVELGVSITSHTSADKVEYAKRKLLESSQQYSSSTGTVPCCSIYVDSEKYYFLYLLESAHLTTLMYAGYFCVKIEQKIGVTIVGNNNRPSSLSTSQPLATGGGAVGRMAAQVKEVLPHVPLDAIRRDLGKFFSVYFYVKILPEHVVNFPNSIIYQVVNIICLFCVKFLQRSRKT